MSYPMAAAVSSGQKKAVLAFFLLFLALGSFFRASGLGERNLWTDEAWVALAATQASPAAVLREGKSTPPWYLLSVWGLVQVLGPGESALRLTSLILGLGTLLLFWSLARTLLPPWYALTAFALASVSHRLVYFSKELKQYSADIFFAVLAWWLVERQLERNGQGGWVLLTVLLGLGLGFSHPLVFMLPTAALVLWWQLPQARRALLGSFGVLGLMFLGYFWFFFRGQVDPELLIYWQADFPDLTGGANFLWWLGAAWSRFGRYFFWERGAPLGFVLLGLGLGYFLRHGRSRVVWYFWGPILAALAAALAQRYPFMGQAGGVRLMMFSAPLLYLLTGTGLAALFAWLWMSSAKTASAGESASEPGVAGPVNEPRALRTGLLRPAARVAAIILAGVVLLWLQPLRLWQENLHPQANREEIAPLLRYLETHQRPGDAIYVYYFAIDPFKFYYQGPRDRVIWGQSCHDRCLPLPPEELQQVQRLWMVFSHFETAAEVDRFIAMLLGPGWTRHLELVQPGAVLFCYLPPWSAAPGAEQSTTPPES